MSPLSSPRCETRGAIEDNDLEAQRLWHLFVGAAIFALPIVVLAIAPTLSDGVMGRRCPGCRWSSGIGSCSAWLFNWLAERGLLRLVNARASFQHLPVPIADPLGTMAAFVYSTVVTVFPQWIPPQSRHVYFEASAVVITLILLGKFLETKSRHQASDAMKVLLKLVPKTGTVRPMAKR